MNGLPLYAFFLVEIWIALDAILELNTLVMLSSFINFALLCYLNVVVCWPSDLS